MKTMERGIVKKLNTLTKLGRPGRLMLMLLLSISILSVGTAGEISLSQLKPVSHAAEATQPSSAQRLSLLSLVQGDGNGYLEDKTLTRAEAVTLILRLTNTTTANTGTTNTGTFYSEVAGTALTNPGFSDVSTKDWFYTPVARAYQLGIVKGYEDKTFKPYNTVSRQEFLKMVLEVLGYNNSVDYTWSEVLTFAKALGLVDESTAGGTFLRRNSFDILLEALRTSSKGTSVIYLEQMKTNRVISDAQYIAFQKSADFIDFIITKATMASADTTILYLNTELNEVQGTLSAVVYPKDNPTKAVKVYQVKATNSMVIIKTAELVKDVIYTVECSGLKDVYGHVSSKLAATVKATGSATGYEFHLENATAVSSRHIELVFSSPLDGELINSTYFRLTKNGRNLFFNTKVLSENKVLLALGEDILATDALGLTVLGTLHDLYQDSFLDGYTLETKVTVNAMLSSSLGVDSVTSLGSGIVRIVYNQPVDMKDGLNRLKYELKDLSEGTNYRAAIKVIDSGKGDLANRQVDVLFANMMDGNLYYLKTAGLSSLGGSYTLASQQTRFTYEDNEPTFKLLSVRAIDLNHFSITFNQPLNEDSVNGSKITINDYTVFKKHLDEKDPYVVHVYMQRAQEASKSCTLKVVNMESAFEFELETVSKSFTTNTVERKDMSVKLIRLVGGNLIMTTDRWVNAIVERSSLNLEVTNSDGTRKRLAEGEYKIISSTEVLIYSAGLAEGAKSLTLKDIYLYGDMFNVNEIKTLIPK